MKHQSATNNQTIDSKIKQNNSMGKNQTPQRMGFAVQLKGQYLEEYKEIHQRVWPEILELISASNIRNYSIFLKEPENILFAYYEYYGTDFAADMEKMKASAKMQEWWKITDAMQTPFKTSKEGEWWESLESVFFHA